MTKFGNVAYDFTFLTFSDTCVEGNGRDYTGRIGVTATGKTCQMWSSQDPHKHTYTSDQYPALANSANFCRNPGGEVNRPWCFTTTSTRWEYCSVPECGEYSHINLLHCIHLHCGGAVALEGPSGTPLAWHAGGAEFESPLGQHFVLP